MSFQEPKRAPTLKPVPETFLSKRDSGKYSCNPCSPNFDFVSFDEGRQNLQQRRNNKQYQEPSHPPDFPYPLLGDCIEEEYITRTSLSGDSIDAMQAQLMRINAEDPRMSPPLMVSLPMFPLTTQTSKDDTFGRNHFGNQVHLISPAIVPVSELHGHMRHNSVYERLHSRHEIVLKYRKALEEVEKKIQASNELAPCTFKPRLAKSPY